MDTAAVTTAPLTTNLSHHNPQLRAVAQLRNAVGQPHAILSDEACLGHLKLAGAPAEGEVLNSQVLRGAALALNAIANSEAYVQKVIETLGLKTDGKALAEAYRGAAKDLREQARELEAAPVVEPGALAPSAPRGRAISSRRVDGYSDTCRSEHSARGCFRRF